MRIESVNKRDSTLFPGAFNTLMEFTQRIGIDLQESALTLDSGFDSQENKVLIKAHGLIPAIYPNRRNMKKPIRNMPNWKICLSKRSFEAKV